MADLRAWSFSDIPICCETGCLSRLPWQGADFEDLVIVVEAFVEFRIFRAMPGDVCLWIAHDDFFSRVCLFPVQPHK